MKNKMIRKIGVMAIAATTFISAINLKPQTIFAEDEYWPTGPDINSPCAVVMEVNTGAVLYEKNSHEQHYPASITKILTTYLAIENSEMDEIVTFSADAVYKNEGDSSHISRDLDEQMTMEQTLYGVMLESANECAYAVAEHVGQKNGGDYQTFIDMMNEKAEELGCKDTHFNNSNGLPDENHYTSAYDMGLISCEAYKNDKFRKITGTKNYSIPPTNKHADPTPLNNHHKILHPYQNGNYVNPYCTGGKTGFTKVANSTLVTYAEKDGLTLCVVIMNANSPDHFNDTNTLIEYCFSNFQALNISENEGKEGTSGEKDLGLLNNNESFVNISGEYIVLPNNAKFSDAKHEIDNKDDNSEATIKYTYAGHDVGKVKLVASKVKVEDSLFDGKNKVSDKDVIKVKPAFVIIIVIAIIALLLLIYFGKKFTENYYVFRHNREVRREQRDRFRVRKQKRRRRRKNDLSFK